MKKECEKLKNYPNTFNQYFLEYGFIAYESMNLNVMMEAVDLYKQDKQKSFDVIRDYYSPENVDKNLFMVRYVPQFEDRIKFIEYALDDYKKEKYYSVIPILLMMIDGIVSDMGGFGFHSDKKDLNVWDSLLTQEDGLKKIQDIFLKGRNKTITDKIDLPYRNGILHGRDLGYDNYDVALKCWVMLFAIRDWVVAINTEDERKKKYQKNNQTKTFNEQIQDMQELDDVKKSLELWRPRNLTKRYIIEINRSGTCDVTEPEYQVLQYFNFWLKNNYGNMVKIENHKVNKENIKNYAGNLRDKYSNIKLLEYEILGIVDEAPAITNVKVRVMQKIDNNEIEKILDIRCIYKNRENEACMRNNGKGTWFIFPI